MEKSEANRLSTAHAGRECIQLEQEVSHSLEFSKLLAEYPRMLQLCLIRIQGGV